MSQIKVELQEWLGSDKSIAEAAWTSSTTLQGKQKRTEEDVKRVVTMLADSGHSTPFESVVLRFWMKLPIQTDRQLMTHRIASHNGMSGRYRTMPNEYLEIPEDVEDILTSIEELTWPNPTKTSMDPFYEYIKICENANNFYNCLIESLKIEEKNRVITNSEYKRLREFFRGVLPQNNMTERVSIFNLRSLSNFIRLRSSPHAQPEIQEIARQMLKCVRESNVCPVAIEVLEKNKWVI